jgi:hypothetical protein
MSVARTLIALVLTAAALGAGAIEPPVTVPPPEDPAAASEEPATPAPPAQERSAPAEAPLPAAEDDETLPPLPAGTVPAGPPPQRFNPTEKVRADFPVSFPIDI